MNHSRGARRADALRVVAESFLSRKPDDAGSVADRYQVVVHIDQRLLASPDGSHHEEQPSSSRRCELEGQQVLALDTARRLSCDCSVVGIVRERARRAARHRA